MSFEKQSNCTKQMAFASPIPSETGHARPEPRPPTHHYLQSSAPSLQQQAYDSTNFLSSSSSSVPKNANGSPAFSPQKWDASSLLNPRSYQQGPRQNDPDHLDESLTVGNTSAALHFQFENPSSTAQTTVSAQHSQGTMPSNAITTAHSGLPTKSQFQIGAGKMLERVHNITCRDFTPHKRRKLNDNRGKEPMEFGCSGGENGGILGQYIREKKEEGKKDAITVTSAGTRPAQILLVDDDDDPHVTSDSEMREVCYGRIEGAEINCFKVPKHKPGAMSISNKFWPQVRIMLRRRVGEQGNIIHAVDSTREIIGCVDVSTAVGLAPLLDSNLRIRTTSRVLTRTRKDGDPLPGAEVSCRYGLDLNIYGPKKHALGLGRHLSQKNLWLRTPLFVDAGVELYNPHAIERPPLPQHIQAVGHGVYRQQGPARTTEDIRNDVIGMFDTLQLSENLPEMEPDSRITTELLRHQKQGLYFMTNKEKLASEAEGQINNTSLWKSIVSANREKTYVNIITGQEERDVPEQVLGGILADMMGLGKTLSMLSLILHTLDVESRAWAQLVPRVSLDNRDLCSGRKGKSALPKLGRIPLVLNAKTTLLVSPLSTIANWEDQIKQHVKPGALKYYVYHGSNRIKDARKLAEFDLIITTYGSVATEFNYRSKKKNGSYPLEEINWFRIILDEAHMIREQTTQQSKAICRLAANRRWAVTGTPVQNRLEDLGALMCFLRIKPFDGKGGFAQYIMTPFKMCDPEILPKLRLLVDSITLRRLKDRIDLPTRHDHLVRLDFSPEERAIYDIFAQNANDRVKFIVGQRETNLSGKSYVHILQSILRLRLVCAHGRDLLGEEDLKVMSGHSKDSAIDLDSDGDDDPPALTPKQAYEMYKLMKETSADFCHNCNGKIGTNDAIESDDEPKDEVVGHMTPCYHIICNDCIKKYKSDVQEVAQGRAFINCPICQQHVKIFYFPLRQGGIDEERSRDNMKQISRNDKELTSYGGPHTKTKALISDLIKSREKSVLAPSEPPIKSVVFSGWTAHLDLIQLALDDNGFKHVRLDGRMSRTARSAAMDTFREDPSVLVILVSITAGGLGLNLTTANKVYVMEPQYNPASEAQAVDRVHRLGQKREVETVRYIMKDSFEEKMLVLQDKKKKLASLSMDSEKGRIDKAEAARKRLEDLRSLFK